MKNLMNCIKKSTKSQWLLLASILEMRVTFILSLRRMVSRWSLFVTFQSTKVCLFIYGRQNVSLYNDNKVAMAKGICQDISSNLVIGTTWPLGNMHVVVQISKGLMEDDFPTTKDALCGLGLLHLSFILDQVNKIMTSNISSIVIEVISPSHLDAAGSENPFGGCKFCYHNSLDRLQFCFHRNPLTLCQARFTAM